MPSYYILLERNVPGVDATVDGHSLSRNSDALEALAKALGVTSLLSFFSIDQQELEGLFGDIVAGDVTNKMNTREEWFEPRDGIQTIEALLARKSDLAFPDAAKVAPELEEFARVLRLAEQHNVRWHLAIDY
jgi:hypothetical protein